MQTDREREGVITIDLMMPIILETISEMEKAKQFVPHLVDEMLEQPDERLADDMIVNVVRKYHERHGPAEFTIHMSDQLTRGCDQWVSFFRESLTATSGVNEGQLTQMWTTTYEPEETLEAPSTPEQPTQSISRLTPGRGKSLRESSDTIQPRALWTTDTGSGEMAQEDTRWVVAVHDAAV